MSNFDTNGISALTGEAGFALNYLEGMAFGHSELFFTTKAGRAGLHHVVHKKTTIVEIASAGHSVCVT